MNIFDRKGWELDLLNQDPALPSFALGYYERRCRRWSKFQWVRWSDHL